MSEFNIATVQEAVSAAYPDRDAVLQGDRRLTGRKLTDRTRRLANVLLAHGLGLSHERIGLHPYESGQRHVAVYLHDSPEYVEAMIGAFKARTAPFNVNYRYVADELRYLFETSRPSAIIYHDAFTPVLAEVIKDGSTAKLLLRVDDGSGHPPLPGAVDYEAALTGASDARPPVEWSPDDLYLLFTGGTTGMPKAVMWRQADVLVGGIGLRDIRQGEEWSSLDAVVAGAAAPYSPRIMTAAPLMHGAGQWTALHSILSGATVVLAPGPHRRGPADLLGEAAAQRVTSLLIVGEAFARPLIDELRQRRYDLGGLQRILTGGAALSAESRAALLYLLPWVTIIDSVGSSETGTQGRSRSSAGVEASSGCFMPTPQTLVVDEDRQTVLPPGHEGIGWLATAGRIPLGYLDDRIKTASTFPVIDGRRMAIAGDRAVWRSDGLIQVLGRDSQTINSGGEKIFTEEVERALLAEPRILDVTVVGRPSDRWGHEVIAIVAVRTGEHLTEDELLSVASRRLARYKLPKQVIFVKTIQRSPAGKADYQWARAVALAAQPEQSSPASRSL